MPAHPKLAPEITLRLDTMTYGGEALGRIEGKAVFVAGGLPGERVRVVVEEDHERFARGHVVEVIEPSPDRVVPRCRYFGVETSACGGCQWQHIAYAAQLRFKTAIVREQLQRLGRLPDPPVRDILPSPAEWSYRNHAQFHLTDEGHPGFQAAGSHRVVAVTECQIIAPPLQAWLSGQPALPRGTDRISVRSGNISDRAEVRGATLFHLKGADLQVSAESFFQVNTSLVETLVDQVLIGLNPQPHEAILDAYCGVGLFSRFLAPRAARVIAVESNPEAVRDFQVNLAAFPHVEVQCERVENVVARASPAVDAAIFDPPRAGCGPRVIEAVIARAIKRIVYISCDPATLARDTRQLAAGGYDLLEVQPLDLFPHTYHIESVALFHRADRAILSAE